MEGPVEIVIELGRKDKKITGNAAQSDGIRTSESNGTLNRVNSAAEALLSSTTDEPPSYTDALSANPTDGFRKTPFWPLTAACVNSQSQFGEWPLSDRTRLPMLRWPLLCRGREDQYVVKCDHCNEATVHRFLY